MQSEKQELASYERFKSQNPKGIGDVPYLQKENRYWYKNVSFPDAILALTRLAGDIPDFCLNVRNWYDVPLFYFGLKRKSFILRFRNGGKLKITSLYDLLNVPNTKEAQIQLLENLKLPVKIRKNVIDFAFSDRPVHLYYNNRIQLLYGLAAIKVIFYGNEYGWLRVREKSVVDIGANIGDTAIYFSQRGAKHVYGFEPFPYSYELAKKNLKLNGLEEKITMYNKGCAGRRTNVRINSDYLSSPGSELKEFKKGKRVDILTLGDIVNDLELGDGAVLKMDCEGSEYEIILHSKKEVLRRFEYMVIEYHYGYMNIARKLKSAGFSVKHTIPKKSINCYAKRWKMTTGLIFATRKQSIEN